LCDKFKTTAIIRLCVAGQPIEDDDEDEDEDEDASAGQYSVA
jgi:hypothetical protein